MYVCCCHAVTDQTVRTAIEAGAHTAEAVTRACRAGGDCGACIPLIESMVEEHCGEATRPSLRKLPLAAPAPVAAERAA